LVAFLTRLAARGQLEIVYGRGAAECYRPNDTSAYPIHDIRAASALDGVASESDADGPSFRVGLANLITRPAEVVGGAVTGQRIYPGADGWITGQRLAQVLHEQFGWS
jgi:hypothetical protein